MNPLSKSISQILILFALLASRLGGVAIPSPSTVPPARIRTQFSHKSFGLRFNSLAVIRNMELKTKQ